MRIGDRVNQSRRVEADGSEPREPAWTQRPGEPSRTPGITFGVHVRRGLSWADYRILAVRSGRGHHSSFVRNSQGGMPIASARLRCSAMPAGSVR